MQARVHKDSAAEAAAAVRGTGKALPAHVQQRAAADHGFGFGHVRVHDEPAAHGAARSLHAAAFTIGGDIGFAAGRYDPGSEQGEALLQHELRHVAQQHWAAASLHPQVDPADSVHERDAREPLASHVPKLSEQCIQRAPEDEAGPMKSHLLFNREQILAIIRQSGDVPSVIAKLGFGPMTSPEYLANYFNRKGVTLDDFEHLDEDRFDRTPQKVLDEVLLPHAYQENRMVSLAVVGAAREVAKKKAAGQEDARQIIAQGLAAAGSAQKGAASSTALSEILIEKRGGIIGTTGRTPISPWGATTVAQEQQKPAPVAGNSQMPNVPPAMKANTSAMTAVKSQALSYGPSSAKPVPVPKPVAAHKISPPKSIGLVAAEKPPLLVQVEIKPVSDEAGGWRQLEQPTRSSYGAIGIITEGGGYEGVAIYDRVSGKVELKVSPIGEGRSSAKTYQIGQFTPAQLSDLHARSGGNLSEFGKLVEAPIRQMISSATGQALLDPEKNASKTGVDWRPQQPPLPFVH